MMLSIFARSEAPTKKVYMVKQMIIIGI